MTKAAAHVIMDWNPFLLLSKNRVHPIITWKAAFCQGVFVKKFFYFSPQKSVDKCRALCYYTIRGTQYPTKQKEDNMMPYWEITCEELGTDYDALIKELMEDEDFIKMMDEQLKEEG